MVGSQFPVIHPNQPLTERMRHEHRRCRIGRIKSALETANSPLSISDEGQPPSSSRRHLALWLFATFQFFYLLTSTGRVRTSDEYNTLYTTESLVLHGTTAVPQAVALHNFYGRPDVHGQPRAAYPPGQAVACMPWYAVGQYALARLPGVPAEDTDLVVAFASCLSSATFAALTVTFFFLLLVGIGTPLRATLLATAMLGLATPIFAYSAWLFSEPLSAAIFTGVAWLLFGRSSKLRNSMPEEGNGQNIEVQDEVFGKRKPISPQTAAIAGLILGLATLVRPTNVIAIAVFAVAVMMKNGEAGGCPSACPEPVEGFAPGFSALTWAWRSIPAALALCVASAVGVVILLAHNALLFGSPFAFGYPAIAEGAKRLNSFDTPILKGLYGFLLSPGKSAFLFAPPIILALIGLGALWRRDRGLATVAILLPLADLLFRQVLAVGGRLLRWPAISGAGFGAALRGAGAGSGQRRRTHQDAGRRVAGRRRAGAKHLARDEFHGRPSSARPLLRCQLDLPPRLLACGTGSSFLQISRQQRARAPWPGMGSLVCVPCQGRNLPGHIGHAGRRHGSRIRHKHSRPRKKRSRSE